MLLVSCTSQEELAVTSPDGNGDDSGTDQLRDARCQSVVLPGHCCSLCREQGVLLVRPRLRAGVLGVLEPAIGVGDLLAVEGLDDLDAFGLGVRQRARSLSRRAKCPIQARCRHRPNPNCHGGQRPGWGPRGPLAAHLCWPDGVSQVTLGGP